MSMRESLLPTRITPTMKHLAFKLREEKSHPEKYRGLWRYRTEAHRKACHHGERDANCAGCLEMEKRAGIE